MARNPQPWTARVLSQPSLDSDPAFLVTFDDAKYLFNCPENTTRTVIQRKYGFNKYRGIFLSRVSSETSAGLPGQLHMSLDEAARLNESRISYVAF
jgi:ribonuclease Z